MNALQREEVRRMDIKNQAKAALIKQINLLEEINEELRKLNKENSRINGQIRDNALAIKSLASAIAEL